MSCVKLLGNDDDECFLGINLIGELLGIRVSKSFKVPPGTRVLLYQNIDLPKETKAFCKKYLISCIKIGYSDGLVFGEDIPYPLIKISCVKEKGILKIYDNHFEYISRGKKIYLPLNQVIKYFDIAKKVYCYSDKFLGLFSANGAYYRKRIYYGDTGYIAVGISLGEEDYWKKLCGIKTY